MNSLLESLTGIDKLSDQIIAADFLNAAKTGIKTYAAALAETTSPEVRDTLKKQLDDAIQTHQEITDLMINKGWYHAKNIEQQIRIDVQNAQKILSMQSR